MFWDQVHPLPLNTGLDQQTLLQLVELQVVEGKVQELVALVLDDIVALDISKVYHIVV